MQELELEVNDEEALEQIRQFLVEHDIVEMPGQCYQLIEALWPELLHKVKPPLERMH